MRRTCSSIRLPATWNPVVKMHARVFYTIELLGKPQLHDEVFREINVKGNRLDTPEKIEAFFVAAWREQGRRSRRRSRRSRSSRRSCTAEDLNKRYKITGTPTIVVNGKYVTDVGMAGGEDKLFQVVNAARRAGEARPLSVGRPRPLRREAPPRAGLRFSAVCLPGARACAKRSACLKGFPACFAY